MKVLMINGSPRSKGNTALALAEIAKQLNKNGIDSEIVWIGNQPVRGCIACGKCSQYPGACVFDDDVCNRISEKFAEADALIVGSSGVLRPAQRGAAQYYPASFLFEWRVCCREAGCCSGHLSQRGSDRFFRNAEHAIPDDEHAHRDLSILEHRLRSRAWAGCFGCRRFADHAGPGKQYGLAVEIHRG